MNASEAKDELKAWLQERACDLELRDEASGSGGHRPVLPATVSIGDLRLLAGGDRPCYGIVLPGLTGAFRWIPFSPYCLPAFDREWRWRDAGPLRVLQLWNVREVTEVQLQQSWRVVTGPATASCCPG